MLWDQRWNFGFVFTWLPSIYIEPAFQFPKTFWMLISSYGVLPVCNGVRKAWENTLFCLACYCVRGLQAHLCGDLHSIESFNEAAQFLDQICTELADASAAIKVSDKIMLDASLKGETWGLLHVLQTPSLLSCLWEKLMWSFPWRNLMWIFPEQCSWAVSILLVGYKLFGTWRKKDFLLHRAQTNIHSLSFIIQTLRSALDFHITFILLHLLLSFSGFMSGH